jgi:hypothetical protein
MAGEAVGELWVELGLKSTLSEDSKRETAAAESTLRSFSDVVDTVSANTLSIQVDTSSLAQVEDGAGRIRDLSVAIDAANGQTISPGSDLSGVESEVSTTVSSLDTLVTKADEVNGVTIAPNLDLSGFTGDMDSVLSAYDEFIEESENINGLAIAPTSAIEDEVGPDVSAAMAAYDEFLVTGEIINGFVISPTSGIDDEVGPDAGSASAALEDFLKTAEEVNSTTIKPDFDSSGVTEGTEEAGKGLDGIKGKAAGVGIIIGLASGGLLAFDSALSQANASTGKFAVMLGITEDEARAMVLELSSATDAATELAPAFETLARNGMTNIEMMKSTASAANTLADATGNSTNGILNDFIPAFKAAGIPLSDLTDKSELFFAAIQAGNGDVSTFSQFLTRAAPDLKKMGYSTEEIIAIYIQLIKTTGSARMAMKELNSIMGEVQASNDAAGKSQEEYTTALENLADATNSLNKLNSEYQSAMADIATAAEDAAAAIEASFIEAMKNQARAISDAEADVAKYKKALTDAANNTEEVARAQSDYEDALLRVQEAERGAADLAVEYQQKLKDLAETSANTAAQLSQGFGGSLAGEQDSLERIQDSIAKYRKELQDAGVSTAKIDEYTKNYQDTLNSINASKAKSTQLTEDYKKAMAAASGDVGKQQALTEAYKAAMLAEQAQQQKLIASAEEYKEGIVDSYNTATEQKNAALEKQIAAEEANLAQLEDTRDKQVSDNETTLDQLNAAYKTATKTKKAEIKRQIDDYKAIAEAQSKEIKKQIDAEKEKIDALKGQKSEAGENPADAVEGYLNALKDQNTIQQEIITSTTAYNQAMDDLAESLSTETTEATNAYNEAVARQQKAITDAKDALVEMEKALQAAKDVTPEVAAATLEYQKALEKLSLEQEKSAKIQSDYTADLAKNEQVASDKRSELTKNFIEDSDKQQKSIGKIRDEVAKLNDEVNKPVLKLSDKIKVEPLSEDALAKYKSDMEGMAGVDDYYTSAIEKQTNALNNLAFAQQEHTKSTADMVAPVGLVAGAVSSLGFLLPGLTTGIGSYLGAAAGGPGIMATLSGAVSGLGTTLAGAAGSVTAGASTIGTALSAGLSSAGTVGALGMTAAVGAGIAVGLAGVFALDKIGVLTGLSDLGKQIETSPIGGTIMSGLKVMLAPVGAVGAAVIDIVRGDFAKIPADMMKPFEQASAVLKPSLDAMSTTISNGIGALSTIVSDGATTIGNAFSTMIQVPAGLVEGFIDTGKTVIDNVVSGIDGAKDAVKTILNTALTLGSDSWNFIKSGFALGGKEIIGAVTAGIGAVSSTVLSAFNSAVNWGADVWSILTQGFLPAGTGMVNLIVDGIKAVATLPYDAFVEILDGVRKLLPFSPAEEGPLSTVPDFTSYLVPPLALAVDGATTEVDRFVATSDVLKAACLADIASVKNAASVVSQTTEQILADIEKRKKADGPTDSNRGGGGPTNTNPTGSDFNYYDESFGANLGKESTRGFDETTKEWTISYNNGIVRVFDEQKKLIKNIFGDALTEEMRRYLQDWVDRQSGAKDEGEIGTTNPNETGATIPYVAEDGSVIKNPEEYFGTGPSIKVLPKPIPDAPKTPITPIPNEDVNSLKSILERIHDVLLLIANKSGGTLIGDPRRILDQTLMRIDNINLKQGTVEELMKELDALLTTQAAAMGARG